MAAYTELNSNKPSGADSRTQFAADALANMRALRDMAITGRAKDFVQSRATGTGANAEHPQLISWLNATLSIGFRMNITWTGDKPTTVQWEWTSAADYPTVWTAMGSAQVNTFDASYNVTATTNSGGYSAILFEIWAKCLKVIADFAAHIAATGTAVHGLGSVATRSASACDLTGTSTLDGTGGVGQTTAPPVDATRVRETFHDYGAIGAGGTVTIEWDKYAHVAVTPNAVNTSTMTFAFSGLPASGKTQSILVEVINGQRSADGKFTYPPNAKHIGSRLVDTAFEAAGRNFFVVFTRDNGTRLEWQHIGKGG